MTERRTYSDVVRVQHVNENANSEPTQSTVLVAEEEVSYFDGDWSVGYGSDNDNGQVGADVAYTSGNTDVISPVEVVSTPDPFVPLYERVTPSYYVGTWQEFLPETPPTPAMSDASGVAISPCYIPRDFGSPSDTAWLLIRQNPDLCEQNGVCPREIENLVRNALVMQSMNPTLSKTDIIGCLCPDGKCKPLPPIGASSIKVVVDCLECEDDCPICLCPMEDEMGCITSCGHIFHRSCFFKVKEDSWGNWKRCPLCRTRLSAMSYNIIRDRFNTWSNCNCCEHHKRRRPSKFCAGAQDVEHMSKCSDPRARVVFELLFRLRECTPTCHCSCRSEMRRLCRLNIYKY